MMTVKLKIQQIPRPRPFKYSSVLGVLAHKRLFIVIITVPFKVKDHVTPIAKSPHINQSIIRKDFSCYYFPKVYKTTLLRFTCCLLTDCFTAFYFPTLDFH